MNEIKLAPSEIKRIDSINFEKLKQNIESLGYGVTKHPDTDKIHQIRDSYGSYIMSIHHRNRLVFGDKPCLVVDLTACRMNEFYLNKEGNLDFFTVESPRNEIILHFRKL